MIIELVSHIISTASALEGRFYPLKMPQDPQIPGAVYTVVNERDKQCSTTHQPYASTLRFQIDIYAQTYSELKQITDQVKSALYSFEAIPSNINTQDLYEPESELYRQIIDFKITKRN